MLEEQKPCLVPASQGFSILYKNKFLYSKYNPQKNILNFINDIQIPQGSIVLCCSALFDYGIKELKEKLPQNCILFGIEFDDELRNFAIKNNKELSFLTKKELYDLPLILNQENYIFENGEVFKTAGLFRRIVRIDFSAGVDFNKELYAQLENSCTVSLKTFWTNRMTLTKFGRKYSHNLFSNLQNLCKTVPVQNYFKSVSKPIIIFGAGESINLVIKETKDFIKNFYIICVDTAVSSLTKNNIIPDAVFLEEAQSIIADAFVGQKTNDIHIFAGMTSIPQISHNFDFNKISFFTTLYTNASFLKKLCSENILPPTNNPLGSVGLTAVEYALKFRTNDKVPVYVCGLDFSYSVGITHAKGSMAHISRLINTNRIISLQNYNAAFSDISEQFTDKTSNKMITTPILKNYAKLFRYNFENIPNLFTLSESGIDLGLPFINTINLKKINFVFDKPVNSKLSFNSKKIEDFLFTEKTCLEELRDLLSGKIQIAESERITKIKELAEHREYLFLHFPDGYRFSQDISFLKRIRTEIDFFLKLFKY